MSNKMGQTVIHAAALMTERRESDRPESLYWDLSDKC